MDIPEDVLKAKMITAHAIGDKPNQIMISTERLSLFRSYGRLIAVRHEGKVYLDSFYWNYSSTTGKYRNLFLNENRKVTEKRIKSGEYILVNMN